MADSTPAFATVTRLGHGARVTVVDLILIFFSGIIVIARAFTRFRITRLFSIVDLLIFSALALAIAESVCVQLAVNHGLGRHQHSLSHSKFVAYSKANYAAQILYVLALACAKFSVTQIIEAIQSQRKVFLATRAVATAIALWTVTSVFGLAFQCHLPGPWLINPNRCVSLISLYRYVGIMNILTDIALVILPIPMMWKIQISWQNKAFVLGLFAIRLIVPAVTVIQLVYLSRYFHSLSDQTWFNATPWILTQVVMNTSIIAACVPSLRRVVIELHTNQTGITVTENMELSMGGRKAYGTGVSKQSGSSTERSKTSASEAENNNNPVLYGHNVPRGTRGMTSVTSVKRGPGVKKEPQVRSSQEMLRQDVITRTLEFSVEEEDRITRSSHSGNSLQS